MRTPKFWTEKSLLSTSLLPLSVLYGLGARLRPLLVKPKDAGLPVLCVGNLTAGGAGKTPTVAALVSLLKDLGKNPHVISRGYKSKLPGPLCVKPSLHDAEEVGDEPLLLARECPVWIGADRVASALKAKAEGADVLIMDDGFQNPSLKKKQSLLVVDGNYGFGNQRLLPAGPLREPLSGGLERADAVLIIGEDSCGLADFATSHELIHGSVQVPKETAKELSGRRVVAFAGIGLPEKFRRTLETIGANVTNFLPFPDHHDYAPQELKILSEKSEKQDAILVTTEKDWVRLPPDFQSKVLPVPIRLGFSDPDQVANWLRGSLVGL